MILLFPGPLSNRNRKQAHSSTIGDSVDGRGQLKVLVGMYAYHYSCF